MAMLSPTRQARVCPCSPDSDVQLKWHEMPLKQLIHGAWLGFQDIYAFDLASWPMICRCREREIMYNHCQFETGLIFLVFN